MIPCNHHSSCQGLFCFIQCHNLGISRNNKNDCRDPLIQSFIWKTLLCLLIINKTRASFDTGCLLELNNTMSQESMGHHFLFLPSSLFSCAVHWLCSKRLPQAVLLDGTKICCFQSSTVYLILECCPTAWCLLHYAF